MSKLTQVVVVLACLVGAYVALISLYLPTSDPLEKADGIVAVSGGDTQGRTNHAVDLYKEGYAPRLIFSGAAADPNSSSNAKVMMAAAAARGVPISAIELDENSRDTKENAERTREVLGSAQSVILVTSDYHQRRVNREFQKALGDDVTLINSPAKDRHWGRKSWFLHPYGWYISLTEPAKLVFSWFSL